MFATQIRPALSLLVVMTLLLGLGYPLAITGVAQLVFPAQSNGSLIHDGELRRGSRLIGQEFAAAKYFHGRPSATAPKPYNALASSGSNLGPLNPTLLEQVKARQLALQALDPGNTQPVPVELVTTSASGLDPEISPAAALYQAARVARVRELPVATVEALVQEHTQGRLLGFIGEARVNVLELNLALDHTSRMQQQGSDGRPRAP
jgi:K+-transporting ATPase ATPase C chain